MPASAHLTPSTALRGLSSTSNPQLPRTPKPRASFLLVPPPRIHSPLKRLRLGKALVTPLSSGACAQDFWPSPGAGSGAGPVVPLEDGEKHSNHPAGPCLLSLSFSIHEMGLLWMNCAPPNLIILRSSTPGPHNVTVFGERVLKR